MARLQIGDPVTDCQDCWKDPTHAQLHGNTVVKIEPLYMTNELDAPALLERLTFECGHSTQYFEFEFAQA